MNNVATKMSYRGTVSAYPMPTDNSGAEFEKLRKHGVKGDIVQAYGGSTVTDWVGDSIYASERMTAGRANGTFAPEHISKSKQAVFDTGHDYEKAIAQHNCRLMTIKYGIECIAIDASKEEYRNSAWPSMAAHLDFFLKVVKGKIVENPNFVIGGPENNYLIVPDNTDHLYIADSKSVQSRFGSNWNEEEPKGVPSGGLKNGVCPTHYRQQMLAYMATLMPSGMIEGAIIFGACGFSEREHAQVFVPYVQEEAEALMDEVERRNAASLRGQIPSVRDCKDVGRAIEELPLQFPDVNRSKKKLELDPAKWKVSFDRILEIDERCKEIDKELKPLKDEFKKKVEDTLGVKLAGSISVNTEESKKLKDERSQILMMPLEEVQDAPGCFMVDPDTGDIVTLDYSSGIKWDAKSKSAVADDYPEIFDDLRHRFPERKPSYDRTPAGSSKSQKSRS